MTTKNPCNETDGDSTLLSCPTSISVGTVVLLLAALVGLPGNIFVIWSILWKMKPSHRSVTCILVLNLAIADGVVLLLTPLFIHFLITKDWFFGPAVCKGVYYLCCINMCVSIYIITLMSVDRCLAVNQPFLSQATRKKHWVIKILTGIWLAAILLSIPAVHFRQVLKDPSGHRICDLCYPTPHLAIFHLTYEAVVGFVIPFTIIVGCYSAILIRLRGVRRRQGARTEKLIVAIVVCFFVLWVPYHIINMIRVASNMVTGEAAKHLSQAWKSGRAGAAALAFLSSSINPVLYVFAARNLIKTSRANFIAQFFEGASESIIKRTSMPKTLARDSGRVLPGAAAVMEQHSLGGSERVD